MMLSLLFALLAIFMLSGLSGTFVNSVPGPLRPTEPHEFPFQVRFSELRNYYLNYAC